MNAEIEILNQKLISMSNTPMSLGLSGRMGHCVYFYLMGNSENKYTEIAGSLLDSISTALKNQSHPMGLYNGLIGIGLIVNYLLRKDFIAGEINQILKQVDDGLLKMGTFSNKPPNWFDTIVLLHYYGVRIKEQDKNREMEYILKRAIFKILNELPLSGDYLFEEPYTFSMEYRLPLFLYVLSELYGLDFFKNKIGKMIDELSHKVLSLMPVLHSHKIYLMLGMSFVSKKIELPQWEKHIHMLRKAVEVEQIWKMELREKNIFFMDGLTGIVFLIAQYNLYFADDKQIELNPVLIRERIDKSEIFDRFLSDNHFFHSNSSLTGFCGLSLLLNKYISLLP